MPKYSDVIVKEKRHVSHQAWWIFYNFGHAAGFILGFQQTKKWIGYEKYPDTFDKYYRPKWELARKMEAEGKRFYSAGLPQLCQVCQIPMTFTEMDDDPTHV
jgi:phenol hydroxylase P3 protein